MTVVILVYVNAFAYLKMGYASAMSFVLFMVIALGAGCGVWVGL